MHNFLDKGRFDVMFALPNLVLTQPVESTFLAIIPSTDSRLAKKAESNDAVRSLANGFRDRKGYQRELCFLVADQNAPSETKSLEGVVSFRNSFAVACVLDGANAKIGNPNTLRVTFSDYFDFFPYCPTHDGKRLRHLGAAANSVDEAQGFHGQIDPELPSMRQTLKAHPDEWLWEKLLERWTTRFVKGRKDSGKLFRSLAIAYHASSVPRKNSLWFHDFGVNIALWVSAFEILSHPRSTGADLGTVVNLLNRISFSEPAVKRKRSFQFRGQRITTHYAGYLYRKIYKARNDFLHGNSVTFKKLLHKTENSEILLNQIVPLIYAIAIYGYIDGTPKPPLPKGASLKQIIQRLGKTGLLTNPYEGGLELVSTGKSVFDL